MSSFFEPKILRRKTIQKVGGFVKLQRPWLRHRHPKYPERAFVMTKRNYKVYADLGLDPYRMFRVLTILDTGAGPNFVRQAELLDELDRYIRHGPLPEIFDANNKPLPMVVSVKLPVKVGTFLDIVGFIVSQTLAGPVILVADFCDRFVEDIRPSKKLLELVDGSTAPIVRRPMKRAPFLPPLPSEQRYDRTQG